MWSSPIVNLTAPPVYTSVGVTGTGRTVCGRLEQIDHLYNLDANTGRELWNFENEETATGMALNDFTLFVSGNGYVKAITRRTGEEIWRTNVQGVVLGSPLVDNNQLVIVTEVGNVQFLDAGTGDVQQGGSLIPRSSRRASRREWSRGFRAQCQWQPLRLERRAIMADTPLMRRTGWGAASRLGCVLACRPRICRVADCRTGRIGRTAQPA